MATAAAPQPVTDRYDMSPAAIYSEDLFAFLVGLWLVVKSR